MTTQNYESAKSDKRPELSEVHSQFQEQGKRLSDVLDLLTNISNRLVDESGALEKGEQKLSSSKGPGLVNDLYNDVNGFRELISKADRLVTKINALI